MACDVRIAARSALFGQPEIKLGIIPGFGGTQRLPRLVGQSKALEMNLVGDPMGAEEAYEYGLASAVVDDHELLDTALAWARKLAAQAPLAVEQIKQASAEGDLDEGIEAEKRAFATVFQAPTRRRGSRRSWANGHRGSRGGSSLRLPGKQVNAVQYLFEGCVPNVAKSLGETLARDRPHVLWQGETDRGQAALRRIDTDVNRCAAIGASKGNDYAHLTSARGDLIDADN